MDDVDGYTAGNNAYVDITATFEGGETLRYVQVELVASGLDDLLREWASGVAATADMPPFSL